MLKTLLQGIFLFLCVTRVSGNALTPPGEPRAIPLDRLELLLPPEASRQEEYAADKLSQMLTQLYGRNFPVVREVPDGVPFISIGETPAAREAGLTGVLPPQSYELTVHDNRLFVRGGMPGPLNGVIALLEEDLGCRWYTSDDTVIPDLRKETCLRAVPRTFVPPFEVRELFYRPGNSDTTEWPMWNRLAPISWHTSLPEASGGQLASPYFIHSYRALLPPEEFYAAHPEYYALQGGKRVPVTPTLGALCYTNPEVAQRIAEKIRTHLQQHPGQKIFSISAPDTSAAQCECPTCAELIGREKLSGAQILLANRVAELLTPDYPDLRLTFLSYGIDRPTSLLPHPNLVNFYAPIGARYNRTAALVPLAENPVIPKQLDEWQKIGVKTYFWDYIDQLGEPYTPYPNFDPETAGLRYLAAHGVSGYLADCTPWDASLAECKRWVFTHLMWDPERDPDALIDEFIHARYGHAAQAMLEYIAIQRRAWERFITAWQANPEGTSFQFTQPECDAMFAAVTQAEADAATQEERERVRREKVRCYTLYLIMNPRTLGIARYEKLLHEAQPYLAQMPPESFLIQSGQPDRWRKKLEWARTGSTINVADAITVDGMSERIDDPAAVAGHAFRHFAGKPWGVQYYYTDFSDRLEPGKTYVIRLRVRAELQRPPSGDLFTLRAFRHGNPTLNDSQPSLTAPAVPADREGQYRWINLGKLECRTSEVTGMFWLDPGVAPGEAVVYDTLELVPLADYRGEPVPDLTLIL